MVTLVYLACRNVVDPMQGLLPFMAAMVVGVPSILLGGVIAAVAAAGEPGNEPRPPKCGECGYSLVGGTGDQCPECGHTVSAIATPP